MSCIRWDVDAITGSQQNLIARNIHEQRARHDDTNLIKRVPMVGYDSIRQQNFLGRLKPLGLENHFDLIAGRENRSLPSRHYHRAQLPSFTSDTNALNVAQFVSESNTPFRRFCFDLFGIKGFLAVWTFRIQFLGTIEFHISDVDPFGGDLNCVPGTSKQLKLRLEILGFVEASTGLRMTSPTEEALNLEQEIDGKRIEIQTSQLDDVLFRSDIEGRQFIQVNFSSGHKILITENLIGFKPVAPQGLDSTRIPKVVTTPDIVSIFEAIQDTLHAATVPNSIPSDLVILRKVFEAVLAGGEAVGFDLATERSWISRIPAHLSQTAS